MNTYGMELYAQVLLEQAREDADARRLLRAARADTERPSTWRRWLRLDRRSTGRTGRLAEAS
jgi:phage terminase large subunit-like protein